MAASLLGSAVSSSEVDLEELGDSGRMRWALVGRSVSVEFWRRCLLGSGAGAGGFALGAESFSMALGGRMLFEKRGGDEEKYDDGCAGSDGTEEGIGGGLAIDGQAAGQGRCCVGG